MLKSCLHTIYPSFPPSLLLQKSLIFLSWKDWHLHICSPPFPLLLKLPSLFYNLNVLLLCWTHTFSFSLLHLQHPFPDPWLLLASSWLFPDTTPHRTDFLTSFLYPISCHSVYCPRSPNELLYQVFLEKFSGHFSVLVFLDLLEFSPREILFLFGFIFRFPLIFLAISFQWFCRIYFFWQSLKCWHFFGFHLMPVFFSSYRYSWMSLFTPMGFILSVCQSLPNLFLYATLFHIQAHIPNALWMSTWI